MSLRRIALVWWWLWLVVCQQGHSQNLVPNPGFEQYRACPPYPGQIHLAEPWDSPNNKTTDFFHRCAGLGSNAGVPDNLLGRQEPLHGDGYIGLRAWIPVIAGNPPYREYASVPLIEPLKSGSTYAVRFWISVAERSSYVSDGLGLFFSRQKPAADSLYFREPDLAYSVGSWLEDDEIWVPVAGTYLARGGEHYLTIGNFRPDSSTLRRERILDQPTIYYYLDEVSVVPCPDQIPILPRRDTALCAGQSMLLQVDPDAWSVSWSDGRTGPEKWIDRPGLYTARLDYGCFQTEQEIVVTERLCGCALPRTLLIQSGQRDWFLPADITHLSLRLFDAQGRLIGVFSDMDAMVSAIRELTAGMYFYHAELSCTSGQTREQVGRWIIVTR